MRDNYYNTYKLGQKVYAMSFILEESDSHLAIFESVIKEIIIRETEDKSMLDINYVLESPSGDEWGEYVSSEYINEDREVLIQKAIEIWDENN